MENFVICVENATLTIFKDPSVKEKSDQLFKANNEYLKNKIQEILSFIGLKFSDEISFEAILTIFKENFHKQVLISAIKMSCSDGEKYNLLENVLYFLSDRMLIYTAHTKPMIDAIQTVLYTLPEKTTLQHVRYSSLIFKLHRTYQESNILSFKKNISEKENRCGECDCSCVCDGSCGGDVNKCTSKIALTKKCNHHCSCYIAPFAEKHSDLFKNL